MKSTKGNNWRTVPINAELEKILIELRRQNIQGDWVLPRLPRWGNGEAAKILKQFLIGNGLKPVKFHALRACFATQLIRGGVAPGKVMKICGWAELKTMQYYIRLAGIEVEVATEGLKILPREECSAAVIDINKVSS